ncbi:hypothetical protein [Streptomyces sp. NPDC005262]|uniref:hypothetical protein n=1 Tax=Streptomyces sp. NPDC005262 TaxID=3364710 RepID=UPI0036C20534
MSGSPSLNCATSWKSAVPGSGQRVTKPAAHYEERFEDGLRLIVAGIEAPYGVR